MKKNFYLDIIEKEAQNQSIEQYIKRGPEHEEINVDEELTSLNKTKVADFSKAYECYAYYVNQGYESALAWDKCACHVLPIELQLQLRQKIKEIKDSTKEASNSDKSYICGIFEENNKLSDKLDKLKSFGIEQEIIDEVLFDRTDGFKITIETDENNPIDKVIADLNNDTTTVLAYKNISPHKYEAILDRPEFDQNKYAGRFSKRKICVIGFPSETRNKICAKLASFYGLEHLIADDILKKAMEIGAFDEKDFDASKEHLSELPSEIMNFAYNTVSHHLDGFVIEGFPFSLDNLEHVNADAIVFVDSDIAKIVNLQKERRWCQTCHRIYHLKLRVPLHEGKCDRCDSKLMIKPEDEEIFIKKQYYNWRTSFNDLIHKLKTLENFLSLVDGDDSEELAVEIHRFLKKVKKVD